MTCCCLSRADAQLETASVLPVDLRCEYRTDPVGIDVARPRLGWILQSATRGSTQTAYQLLVASSPAVLASDTGDLWDSGKVSSDQMNQQAYGGKALTANQQAWWKVRAWDGEQPSAWSAPAQWTMGLLSDEDWKSAKWIAAPNAQDPVDHKRPLPRYETLLLRRELKVRPALKRALIHLCGLGLYELTINGSKVGDAMLTPGWTDYKKACLVDSYDITALLKPGMNAAGIFLGNGFYNVHGTRYTKVTGSYGPLKAIATIRLEYADGKSEDIVTDATWKAASGPITFSSIYGGEDYDARLEQKGWDTPGFDDSSWQSGLETEGPGGKLVGLSHAAPPVRTMQILMPVARKQLSPSVTVYDFGQNAAIMVEFKVRGPAGSSVKITPSELVSKSGSIEDRMCGGQSYWLYTLRGDGEEEYVSKFYYRGGQYLQVEALPAPGQSELPTVVSIQNRVIRADSPSVGEFATSNELYNRIFSLIRWAQMSNMMSIMTDCPHREKLGWLEEDHLNGPALRYNFDMAALFTKMTDDMFDAQRTNGLVPSLVPNYYNWDEGKFTTPIEWGSACIYVPWQQYLFDADIDLLRQHYEGMKKYMGYLERRSANHLISFGLGDWYDNHSEGEPKLTPVGLTDSAFYYQNHRVLAAIAKILGDSADAQAWESEGSDVLAAFNAKYFDPTTDQYGSGSQGANCLPLAFGMVPPGHQQAVFNHLVTDIEQKGTTAGEVSFEYLLRALVEGGRSDLIYSTYGTDKQGYGLQVKLGKTSLTEAWNGGSASQNHFMYGQINEWFYRDLAGIQADPEAPGFRKIIIRPAIVGDLTWVKASYHSIRGTIVSNWTHEPTGLTLNVTIPVGSTATVYVPAAAANLVKEGGVAASSAPSVRYLHMENGAAVYAVGSGTYAFSSADVAVTPPEFNSQAQSGQVTLSWKASANAASYTLKRSATGGSDYQAIARNIKETTYIDRGLSNEKTYDYRLSAVNALGESAATEARASPAMVIDSGFEEPVVSDFVYNPTGSAWTFSEKSGVSSAHSGMTAGNPTGPPEGAQVAFVQQDGVISQVIGGLTPGITYSLIFSAAQRIGYSPNGQTWQVKLDDTVIENYSPPKEASTYADYTATFTATSASEVLSFVGTNTRGGDNTIFIDHVRIQPARESKSP